MRDFEAQWVVMLAEEVDQMLDSLRTHGDYCVLLEWATEVPPREYMYFQEVPPEQTSETSFEGRCMFWDRATSPPLEILPPEGDRMKYHLLADNSEVIYLRYRVELPSDVLRGRLEVNDWVQQRDGTYGHRSAESWQAWQTVKKWLRKRTSLREPILDASVTADALSRLRQMPNPPDWASTPIQEPVKSKPVMASSRTKRKSYKASLDEAKAMLGLEGSPKRGVWRQPEYGDQKPGPSWFRTEIEERQLHNLTLPGLYIGHSRLTEVSFQGSDLHLSTFNWNDFQRCDFSGCDLSHSDLRGCKFEACKFGGADLSQADLRNSSYNKCDFGQANLKGAILHYSQKRRISLSVEQLAAVAWTDDMGNPEDDVRSDE
jgi:hypothetical protein